MVNIKKQSLFSVLIVIGAIILLYDLATEKEWVELKIGGLITLMIGLYGATRQWVDDNKKETPNESITEKESQTNENEDEEKKHTT